MKVISLCTQKGGVGKTTTVHHMASAIKKWWPEVKTLSIDLDPQANLSSVAGIEYDKAYTWLDFYNGQCDIGSLINKTYMGDVIACNARSCNLDNTLQLARKQEYKLSYFMDDIKNYGEYDLVLIDCQASFSLGTLNALVASNAVYSPLQMEPYASEGLEQFFEYVLQIKSDLHEELRIGGIIRTMYDQRLKATKLADEYVTGEYPEGHMQTIVRRNTDLSNCVTNKQSVFEFSPNCNGSLDYKSLTEEFLLKEELI